ncbi:hypothetical protein F4821DRAFT_265267 [Hypoxylon rubiginosum]|uniref:Uncharacterized protein n=1 Tax=Hypoxylon rubiginosum TaxID=110542 RepID=A0ACC0CL84_9PEZI|nr:hypothetical protein F4821DRAFT_265267 [Hypoxylon rubiginosum]
MASRSFTYDTPSPSASRETRTRARLIDGVTASPEDPTSKGGRSLRRRPRVDYTFENLEETESQGAKATPTTTRAAKKRKLDFNDNDTADDFDHRTKRRASEQPQSSSTRRRNYTRKSTVEPQTYVPQHQMDDVEVQDTIEVGGHHSSESDESILRRTSSGSSSNDSKAPPNNHSVDVYSALQSMGHLQTEQRPTLEPNPLLGLQRDVEDEDEDEEAEDVEDDLTNRGSLTHLEHLTPYIQGSYIYYPEYPEDEPEADADAISEADSNATREADADANSEVGPDADATADLGPKLDITNEDATQQDTVARDVATNDSTPAVDDQADGLNEDTPAETAANTPSAAVEPANNQHITKDQFRFKTLRSASEYVDLFSDIKSLSPEELYYRAEVVNRSLVAWQNEYNELRKLTDDHNNSIRYKKEEESYERRCLTAASKNNKLPEHKDFIVKGVRAEKEKDAQAYKKQQDRIMASVYGFEYDPRPDAVGKQNPIEQRYGLDRSSRLRNRLTKTPKAAEAENSAQGRRTRRAPERFNGGDPASRGSSPAPAPRRGRRTTQIQENADMDSKQNSATPAQIPEPVVPEPQKKKGKGGRPRKNPLPEPAKEYTPTLVQEPESGVESKAQPEPKPESQRKTQPKTQARSQAKSGAKALLQEEVEPLTNGHSEAEQKSSPKRGAEDIEEQKQPARKRRRQAPATSVPATTPVAEDVQNNVQDTANGTESRPIAKPSPRRRNSRKIEDPTTSFNTVSSGTTAAIGDQDEETRPLTSSSTATAATVTSTSNYQLREKRQRKFTNDITDDDFLEEPKPKRARAAPRKQTRIKNVTATSEPAQVQQSEPEVPPAAKASKIIKLKVPSSRPTSRGHSVVPSVNPAPVQAADTITNGNTNGQATTNGAMDHSAPIDGAEGMQPKDYSTMTKSEKMSASMKARWNSGSMDGAVQKRRATLAAKKQNAKAPAPSTPTNPDQGQTGRPSEDTESEDNKEGVATGE